MEGQTRLQQQQQYELPAWCYSALVCFRLQASSVVDFVAGTLLVWSPYNKDPTI